MTSDYQVDEQTLRQVELLPFEAGAASTGAIMCSYNKLNGEPACGSSSLLTDILRTDWDFGGLGGVGLVGNAGHHGPSGRPGPRKCRLTMSSRTFRRGSPTAPSAPRDADRAVTLHPVDDGIRSLACLACASPRGARGRVSIATTPRDRSREGCGCRAESRRGRRRPAAQPGRGVTDDRRRQHRAGSARRRSRPVTGGGSSAMAQQNPTPSLDAVRERAGPGRDVLVRGGRRCERRSGPRRVSRWIIARGRRPAADRTHHAVDRSPCRAVAPQPRATNGWAVLSVDGVASPLGFSLTSATAANRAETSNSPPVNTN